MGVGTVVRTLRLRYVIIKFSQMDSLSNFLTHGAPLESSAIMRDTKVENTDKNASCLSFTKFNEK